MTSATKFISGQSDVTGGILACRGEQLGKDIISTRTPKGLHLGRSTAARAAVAENHGAAHGEAAGEHDGHRAVAGGAPS